jgi:hypothetical protein
MTCIENELPKSSGQATVEAENHIQPERHAVSGPMMHRHIPDALRDDSRWKASISQIKFGPLVAYNRADNDLHNDKIDCQVMSTARRILE